MFSTVLIVLNLYIIIASWLFDEAAGTAYSFGLWLGDTCVGERLILYQPKDGYLFCFELRNAIIGDGNVLLKYRGHDSV